MGALDLAGDMESMAADADVPARWKPALIRAARYLRAGWGGGVKEPTPPASDGQDESAAYWIAAGSDWLNFLATARYRVARALYDHNESVHPPERRVPWEGASESGRDDMLGIADKVLAALAPPAADTRNDPR